MTDAERWLREHTVDAPAELLEVMIGALPPNFPGGTPAALAAAAITLYEEVIDGGGGREAALPLLAADALFTHAFEVQMEIDPGGLEEFAAKWGGTGSLGRLASP
ncbi:MAG: hypothetical protein WD766_11795 [Gemmatimonadota bacterium]